MVTFARTPQPLRPGPALATDAFSETPFGGVLARCETLEGRAEVPGVVLLLSVEGTLRVDVEPGRSAIVPAGHGLVVPGARALKVSIGLGSVDAYAWSLAWPKLTESLAERSQKAFGAFPCRSLAQSLDRAPAESAALARALRVAAEALVRPTAIDLAQHGPIDDPGTATVVARLKARERLTLKQAAEEAGYSHFHFSRRFRDVTGYGFHEFVDRVRTSAALRLLAREGPLSDLAAETGFPSVKAMQESVLDYTGFSLRELRAP
ncbi:MAG: helix-turn-helix transcriptional regulator [Fimbriimonadaceae bacterium]|nr:helix-turn-helix transcriptional regulator [Fimbriimonadaceae bacterium]